MNQKTVLINGVEYDALTGVKLKGQAPDTISKVVSNRNDSAKKPTKKSGVNSNKVHNTLAKSKTLNRRILKNRPVVAKKKPVENHATIAKQPKFKNNIKPSGSVSRFAPHPKLTPGQKTGSTVQSIRVNRKNTKNVISAKRKKLNLDIKPSTTLKKDITRVGKTTLKKPQAEPVKPHPVAKKANAKLAQKNLMINKKPIVKPAGVVKDEAIIKAISNAKVPEKISRKMKKSSKIWSFVAASFALVLFGGYLTYVSIPNISTRVAAMQAGINATFPQYKPSGYSLNGPVIFNDGKVAINFMSNSSDAHFTVNQAKSPWNSSALLDNYVKKQAGNNYITHIDRGLTIYTFDKDAAWVSGGILYTITGDAPLSTDQVRKIAASM